MYVRVIDRLESLIPHATRETIEGAGHVPQLTTPWPYIDSTKRARTFYRVYRASAAKGFSEMVCEPRGVDRCDLRMETLTTTRDQRYVDADPPPDAIYRVGVAANWLDEEDRGDVFAISPPAAP